jgi:4-hydroxy-2-oxoheptanedioate aldolase
VIAVKYQRFWGVIMSTSDEQREPLNRLRALWRKDMPALGAFCTIPSVQVVQIMAQAGLDWVLIDMEHSPIDAAAAHAMIAATAGTQLVPLVRLPSVDTWQAKIPLDLGAFGVCFPMTSTRNAAEKIVEAVRYPPLGTRHWGPFYAPLRWGVPMLEYLACADDEILAIGTLEHADAIGNLQEVVTTPGLDLLFIGPGDLATSMGFKGRPETPEVQAAIAVMETAVRNSAVVLGGVAPTAESANAMIERGYRALVLGFDWSLLQRGITSAIAGIER